MMTSFLKKICFILFAICTVSVGQPSLPTFPSSPSSSESSEVKDIQYKYDAFAYFFNIQRRPSMYVYGVDDYPVLLFADAFLGGECVTWTSRYRSDGRENYDFSKLTVRFQLHGIDMMIFDPPYKIWESNAVGQDTPVRQIQFCEPSMAKVRSLVMFVQYEQEPVRQFTLLRFSLPKVDAAACTMSSLKDLWSARAWVEHHRNLGIDRFNIYINSEIPSPADKSLLEDTKNVLGYLLYQKDVVLIEWPYDFKDPNTTRDKVTQPLHYARPLEWNSCNEREHYGASTVLFNDMDEFVVSKYPILDVVRRFPDTCRGVHIGQYWTKVICQKKRDMDGMINSNFNAMQQELGGALEDTLPAFDSLNTMRSCKMFHDPRFVIDPKRRAKMLIRTERDDIHDIFNHDLSIPLPDECKCDKNKKDLAFQYHIINLRPKAEHASASKFASIKHMLKSSTEVINVDQDFYPYRRDSSGVLSNYASLERDREKLGTLKKVRSEAKLTNKNEIVFESFPTKREIKQIKKEFKKQRKEQKQKFIEDKNIDGFDELDQFFQKLGNSENYKQDQKTMQEFGIPNVNNGVSPVPSNEGRMKYPQGHPKKPKSSPMKTKPKTKPKPQPDQSPSQLYSFMPPPKKRGFDFEKEFRETGELQQWQQKIRSGNFESTPEYFLKKSHDYLHKLSSLSSNDKKDVPQGVDINAQRQYIAQRKRNKEEKRNKENRHNFKNCPFPLTLPKQRPQPVQTKEGVEIFPFQYAFQQQRITRDLRQSLYDFSIIWPVQSKSRHDSKRGYIFNDEASYYKEYGQSIFAYTYRKGGWESMRHYEIMCNGAIPYFIDLDKMPPHTMTRFPKDLVLKTMSLPGIDPIAGALDKSKLNSACLQDVRATLLDYCYHNLTTKALAKYFLAAMNKPNAKKVLMINGRQQWEYMTDSLLHGLRVVLGKGFVDYKQRLFMYKGLREKAIQDGFREYGKGFSYAYALVDDRNIVRDVNVLKQQIRGRYFDLIVIGQMFQPKNLPQIRDWETSKNLSEQLLWNDIISHYHKEEIALLDGLDYHKPEQREFLLKASKYGKLFVREIDRHVLKGEDNVMSWKAGSETATKIWDAKMKLAEN